MLSHIVIILWIGCRKGRHHLGRSQNLLGPIFVTWSLYLRWLGALLEYTMGRPLTRLKSNLRWSVITLLNSQFHTSLLSTVDLVLVLLTPPGSFLSSELPCLGDQTCTLQFILKEKPKMILFLILCLVQFYFDFMVVV